MMTRVLIFGLWTATLVAATPGEARIGIYHWGGRSARSVSGGIEKISGLGGHVARIAISPRNNRDYNIATDCIENFSLVSAAQTPDVKAAFDNPDIDVIILTAYDGVTWG